MVEYTQTVWLLPMLALVVLPYVGIAYWVYRDATRRGSEHATAWGVGMVLLGPASLLGLAYYLYARRHLEGPHPPPTRFDRLVRNVAVASLLTFLVGAAFSPPDPLTQASIAAVALPVLAGVAVLYTYRDVLTSAL